MLIRKHQIEYKHYFKVYFMGNPPLNDLGIEQCSSCQWLPTPQPEAPQAGTAFRAVQVPLVTGLSGPQSGDGLWETPDRQTDTCPPGCWIQYCPDLCCCFRWLESRRTSLLVLSREEKNNQPWISVEVTSSPCSSPGCPVRASPFSGVRLNCNNR